MLETHRPSPLLLNKKPLTSLPTTDDYHVSSPAAVPFTWESHPGTPKIKFPRRDAANAAASHSPPLSPLTPPPSYFYSPSPKRFPSPSLPSKKKKKGLFEGIFSSGRRTNDKYSKATTAATSTTSSSSPVYSSSSSYSSSSTSSTVPSSPVVADSCGARMSFADMLLTANDHDHRREEEGGGGGGSPVSVLCFGVGRGPSNSKTRPGCYGSFGRY